MSTLTTRGRIAGAITVAALSAFLAVGCSTSSGGQAPEAESSSSADAGSKDPNDRQKEVEEWQIKFAECMRGEGIDMPDDLSSGQLDLPDSVTQEDFAAALETCEEKVGSARGLMTDDEAEKSDNAGLEFSACLREKGYDVEDPEPGAGMFKLPEDVSEEDLNACEEQANKSLGGEE